MPFAAKLLALGDIAITTPAALYTVPALTTAYIKKLRVFNTNAAAQTVDIFIRRSATNRQVRREPAMAQYAHFDDLVDIALNAGDEIYAVTTTASAVTFHVFGVEET